MNAANTPHKGEQMSQEVKVGTVVVMPLPSDGVEVFRALVTPEMAAEWLSCQMRNRNMRQSNIDRWAGDMRAGRFQATVQPLLFDTDGVLIDGQNRLAALIKSGLTGLTMWIAVGVPISDRSRIDLGSPRSSADVLFIEDVGINNRHRAAALARMVINYGRIPDRVWSGSNTAVSVPEVIQEIEANIEQYRRAVEYSKPIHSLALSGAWLTATAHGALSIIVERHSGSPDLWDDYHDGVSTGAGLSETDPRLTLRNARTPAAAFSGSWRQQAQLLASLKTWNAWVKGDSLKKIYAASPKYLPLPTVI